MCLKYGWMSGKLIVNTVTLCFFSFYFQTPRWSVWCSLVLWTLFRCFISYKPANFLSYHPTIINTSIKKKKKRKNMTPKNILPDMCAQQVSDQPAHSRSLIRIFTGRILDSQGCSFYMRTTNTLIRLGIRRLIWIAIWRTCQKVRVPASILYKSTAGL